LEQELKRRASKLQQRCKGGQSLAEDDMKVVEPEYVDRYNHPLDPDTDPKARVRDVGFIVTAAPSLVETYITSSL
jgi:hypothetical protein